MLKIIINQPVIQTHMLLKGDETPEKLRVQLGRWVASGKLVQLKRGYFALSPEYAATVVSNKFLATFIYPPSYLSLEYALSFYDVIPEAVYIFTLITTRRPSMNKNKLFTAEYRHIKKELFWGFQSEEEKGQTYFIATPEKALLDLLYFSRTQITDPYLRELRLQNLEILDEERFLEFSGRFKSKKIEIGAKKIIKLIEEEREEYQKL
ncbi:MAG: hypothetical protein ABIE74_08035 [Pseudomonadota bacterium]